jgi:hypothetical protein
MPWDALTNMASAVKLPAAAALIPESTQQARSPTQCLCKAPVGLPLDTNLTFAGAAADIMTACCPWASSIALG